MEGIRNVKKLTLLDLVVDEKQVSVKKKEKENGKSSNEFRQSSPLVVWAPRSSLEHPFFLQT